MVRFFEKFISYIEDKLFKLSKSFSRMNLYEHMKTSIETLKVSDCKQVLNIGSGGVIENILIQNKILFRSLDIDRRRNPDILCNMEDMSMLKDQSYDAVFCMEVLEHVRNPFKAVEEVFRILKKGGVVIGSTPFILGIHDYPIDYYRYTKYGLESLFNDFTKLELVERNTYMQSVLVLPLRLFVSGTRKEKFIILLMLPFLFVIYILSFGIKIENKDCCTGYYFVFKK